jgi:NAD(P)-dependent dehydrogenase (short-subunit alcohol dehydrogenase family)
VNAIAPAAIATPMLAAGFAADSDGFARLESYHPTLKIGSPEEIAELAMMLAGRKLPFLNGAVIPIDGGIGVRLHDPA